MKTLTQKTYGFAKYFLPLAVVLGLVACGGGGGGGGGGGSVATMTLVPNDWRLSYDLDIVNARAQSANAPIGAAANPGNTYTLNTGSFTLSVRVTNEGGIPSPNGTVLSFYRSTDEVLGGGSDVYIGSITLAPIAPSATTDATHLSIAAPTDSSPYHYGTCARSTNDFDCGAVALMKIDETITVVSGATPSSPNWDLSVVTETVYGTGQSFTLTATVKNANSAGRSDVSSLIFYRSTDTTITTADTPIGDAVPISALTGGSTATQSIALTSPTIFGTYYYGACVTVAGDINTSNDCSAAATWRRTGFDLSVTGGTDKASVLIDEQFVLTATIANDPSATVNPTVYLLGYYRSDDSIISLSDTKIRSYYDNAPRAGGTVTDIITVTAPSTPGTYYYGACAQYTGGFYGSDYNMSNDCSSGVDVVVSSPPPVKFDLSLSAYIASNPYYVGLTYFLRADMYNSIYATESSPETTVYYYQSSDSIIDSSDNLLGTKLLSPIMPGGDKWKFYYYTPTATGRYYYGACVDAEGDADSSNNCSGWPRTVTRTGFDLSTNASVNKASVAAGEAFQLTATVTNDSFATTSSRDATLRYYRSTDATIDSNDTELDSGTVSALSTGLSATDIYAATAPSSAGTYYYGACAVASGDGDTSNDCSSAVSVVVTE